ncbi:saccharopine dehydrogenase family protein [Pyxidicoccus caerfyrddinensis]|uniref:saccharopine dehydrogenase family protein n=1 Tax=Pyxidicoccus caerfyrddinensis TaxID=2709663 RepID=UPI0013D9FE1E|nr:saccharopine dehydrogenase NADP-binding domain-containing protein [Pyxidicoccus caerfyrddinensis]
MAPSTPLLLYGATGYTGRLLARAAREHGLRPVLGGRDGARLAQVAAELGLEHRVASLEGASLDAALHGMRAVLHAAGPFSATSLPMVEACLRTGVHYLDLSGEVAAIESVRAHDARARQRGVMLLCGAGFDVVPSDCLALGLARQLPGARKLVLGISGLELISRGSLRTLAEGAGQAVLIRQGNQVVGIPPGSRMRELDFGAGPRPCVALSWADVATAHASTGIPDIEVYCEAIPALRMLMLANRSLGNLLSTPLGQLWLELQAQAFPPGPTEEQRAGRQAVIVCEVEDGAGRCLRGRLRTPEVYGFSCTTAWALARRVLAEDVEAGFQTPARVYGPEFVLAFPGVVRDFP